MDAENSKISLSPVNSGPAMPLGLAAVSAPIMNKAAVQLKLPVHPASAAEIAGLLPRWAKAPDIYAVVLMSQLGSQLGAKPVVAADAAPDWTIEAVANHLTLCSAIDTFSKPVISLIDGPLTVEAVGQCMFGTHRVAGAGFDFSIPPPTTSGLPAGGIAYILARLDRGLGLYLALTGRRIGRGDALAAGLVTHCIEAGSYEAIIAALGDARPVDPVLDGLHRPDDERQLAGFEDAIARCFSAATFEDIITALKQENGRFKPWASQILSEFEYASSICSAATVRLVRMARALDFRESLIITLRVATGLQIDAAANDARVKSENNSQAGDMTFRVDQLFLAPEHGDLALSTHAHVENARF